MAGAGGGESAGAGEAAPFPSRAFIPGRELPGSFPERSQGAVPHWPLSTDGCVPLNEQGGERREAAPGTAAASGPGAREVWHCTVPRISQGLLGPRSPKGAAAFCEGSPLACRVQGAEPKGNLDSGACLAAEPCATTHSYSVGIALLSTPSLT